MNDELLIKFLLKETGEDENTIVQQWLDADPSNTTYFAQFEKLWEAGKKLSSKSSVDEEQAWLKFKERTAAIPVETIPVTTIPMTTPPVAAKEMSIKPAYTWLKIAAIFVLAIGAWTIYNLFNPSGYYTELTAKNEVISKILPDGTALTLNKNTHISYAGNFKTHRRVKLESGDVFFNVAHDKVHPFIIEADKVSVEVVGTSFNVKHVNKSTEVNVETGIVKVTLGDETIKLYKGDKVRISNNTKQLLKEQSSDRLYNYYHSRLFELNNTPLWKLVLVLNEAYGSNITLDPSIRALTFSTTLKKEASLDRNLDIICMGLNLNISRNGEEILLSNKKP